METDLVTGMGMEMVLVTGMEMVLVLLSEPVQRRLP